MTAQDALKLTQETRAKVNLDDIYKQVTAQALNGSASLTYIKPLNAHQVNRLRAEGYKVTDNSSTKDGATFVIEWAKPSPTSPASVAMRGGFADEQ